MYDVTSFEGIASTLFVGYIVIEILVPIFLFLMMITLFVISSRLKKSNELKYRIIQNQKKMISSDQNS